MLYNVDFNISGAVFLIVFYLFLKIQYTTNSESNKKFRALVLVILFADILDMVTAITISYSEQVPLWLNYFLNILYFISSAGTGHALLVYIRYMMEPDGKRHFATYINDAFFLVYSILTISTPFTHLLFYFDENRKYMHGPLYLALFLLPIYYIFYSLFWVILRRNRLKKKQLFGVVLFVVFSLVGAILQMIFFTDMLLSFYTSSVAAFIIMFSLETPDYQNLLKTLRDLEIAKKEAEEARKEADKANKAKSDFLANMSHEIRTPLNGVNGLTQAALDVLNTKELNEETKEEVIRYLYSVSDAGNNLLSIINDILDISKIESGKMEIVNVKYRMSSLVSGVFNMLSMKAREKGLRLIISVRSGFPAVICGDEVRLRQIMINLINNAVKYTKSGEVLVDISFSMTGEEDIKICIEVKDTGVGIKPEDMDKLFGNFQRVDMVSNRNIEGTGLGLQITKKLSNMMGGDVTVESIYGQGSTFTASVIHKVSDNKSVSNLIVLDNRKDEYSLDSVERIKHSARPTFRGKKILVVDDVKMNLMVMTALLKDLDLEIETADSGQKCLLLTKKSKYDLIFMDHMMPQMDGIETFKRLKASAENLNHDSVVIMLTANAVNGSEEEYLRAGFTDYLSKPVEAERLYYILSKYLKN